MKTLKAFSNFQTYHCIKYVVLLIFLSSLLNNKTYCLIFDNHDFYNRTDTTDNTSIKITSQLTNGTFHGEFEWLISPLTETDIIRGHLEFTPKANAMPCSNISFIQITRLDLEFRGDSKWESGEYPRELIKTSDNENAVANFYIDHKASNGSAKQQLSPFFRDHWPNPNESHDGYLISDNELKSASLVDYPYGWDSETGMDRIRLEACAVCRSNMKNYGCIKWGANRPLLYSTPKQIFIPETTDEPSPTFIEALKLFNNYYGNTSI